MLQFNPSPFGFDVVYADPPWSYYNNMSVNPDCTTVKGVRRPPYPVLSLHDIKAQPVSRIANNNAMLFIWTTDYHLRGCLEVMQHWGFTYKTVAFAWQKLNKKGKPVTFCGAYTLKSGVELCLLGTRGNTKGWVINRKVRALVQSERGIHSQKPPEVRDRIVELVGDRPRIEMFARERVNGWTSHGLDLGVVF
jgi:site-specific DNA-methyltransferase (adenine-specific)